jgi:2-dehydro-3-deoxyglucarate aldolase/4-hydroxy-2-oxoheptanedioate aldolase
MAQIETIEGVKQAAKIASIDGIDVLFVGPSDLQFDLKNRPDAASGDYAQCLSTVITAAKAAGKAAGILIREPAEFQRHVDLGFTCIAMDSDLAILRKAYVQMLSIRPHT